MAARKSPGLGKETEAALAYVLGPLTGVLFLLLEENRFVRFHAMQSIVVFGGFLILQAFLTFTIILAVLVPLISLTAFVLWLVLIYKAWQGEEWEVPFAGRFARQLLKKV